MKDTQRPNILFISTDQHRTDTFGCYGGTHVTTPHFDALAERGVLFTRAYTPNTVCIPARCCWMTGRYIHQHGVMNMAESIDDTTPLPEHEVTVPELLQTAGYRTAAFGKLHVWPERGYHEKKTTGGKGMRWVRSSGMEIGLAPLGRDYAAWLEKRHPGGYEMIYEQRRRPEYRANMTAIENVLPLEEYVDYWTAENTIDWIRQKHDRPWFAWCGFCSPHDPVDPPQPYSRMYDPAKVELPPNYAYNFDGTRRETTKEQDAVSRRFVAHYWGLCRLLDDQVGRVMKALNETGQAENTLVIYTADHGDFMTEYGTTGKTWFFDPIMRVPFILIPPGGKRHAQRYDGIIETHDLAPTMLDYAGAGIPARMSASTLRSRIERGGPGKPFAFSHYVSSRKDFHTACVVDERYKYVWADRVRPESFFDLANDPFERNNRIHDPAYAGEIGRLRCAMIDRLCKGGPGNAFPG